MSKSGPVINKAALDRIHNYVQIGQKEGARVLTARRWRM
jgi:acyl-CoA reductase-like NAD-dependent aldehyde dehydrogenase